VSTVKIEKLQVLAIYSSDLERSKRFYIDHLGFEEAGQMPPGVLLAGGGMTLYLEGGREPRAGGALAHPCISPCLDPGGVREAHDRLAAAGVPIVEKLQVFGDQFAMTRIADPDGNVLELAGAP
jgi:catechol 2,3-dioxygenase-like lactoylglutathione lyase family enzyme